MSRQRIAEAHLFLRNRSLSSLIFFFALLTTNQVVAWSYPEHTWINRAACRQAAIQMPGLENYENVLALLGPAPDFWKGADPSEGQRHYIDLEHYDFPEVPLNPDQPGILTDSGQYDYSNGIAPWTIMDILTKMTDAMKATNWVMAIRCAGVMGHYVGDIHMPLHNTSNFNGQETGNTDIHGRWESEMTSRKRNHDRPIPDTPPEYLEQPWNQLIQIITAAYAQIPVILNADDAARSPIDGDTSRPAYFDILWDKTHVLFTRQTDLSAHHLASLWYTAWVNAGKPLIPLPSDEITTDSIHQTHPHNHPPTSIFSWVYFLLCLVAVVFVVIYRRRR